MSLAAHIDRQRLWQRHEALARFGATGRGGVNRQALSDEEIAARAALVAWARALDLEPSADAMGNLFLRLPGTEPEAAPVLTGSHIDTQPTGGKYDGAYGVLAGLEALQAMRQAGFRPRRPIDVVAWMNEEGSRFAPGMMGSEAFRGLRAPAAILPIRDADGISVADALARVQDAEAALPRRPLGFPVASYVEAHIEQGPELELAGRTIGVVTGMQGKRTFRVTVAGEASHAGTTPRARRQDALLAAAAMVLALEQATGDPADIVRFTIGRFTVRPNAPSVVPGEVVFSIDLRHPGAAELTRLGDAIPAVCAAHQGRCTVKVEELATAEPLEFPAAMRDRVRAAAERLGLSHMDLPSAAGHDARHLHYLCPTGMIFVPCWQGISHNEAERATADDLAAGAQVLVELLAELSV